MKQSNFPATPRLALSTFTLAVPTLMNQAQAQQADAPMERGQPSALATGFTSANTYVFRWKANLRISSRVVFAQNVAKPIGRTWVTRGEYMF